MSREIDALVAEKVMGWLKVRFMHDTGTGSDNWYGFKPNEYGVSKVPRYSTNISDAWQVVEKMEKQVDFVQVGNLGNGDKGYSCQLITMNDSGDWEEILTTADTAPMAICLAALKVKGVEV